MYHALPSRSTGVHLAMALCLIIAVIFAPRIVWSVAAQSGPPDVSHPPLPPSYGIGVMYSGSGSLAATGLRTKQVMQLCQGLMNNKTEQLGFSVNVLFADVASDVSRVWDAAHDLALQNVSFLVAPEGVMTGVASQYGNYAAIPVVSRISASTQFVCGANSASWPAHSDCHRPNTRAFTYASTVLQPAQVRFRDYYALVRNSMASLRMAQADMTAAFVYFDDDFHTEACTRGDYFASNNKMTVVSRHVIYANYTRTELREIIADLQARNPAVLTWCRRLGCAEDLALMREMQYSPPSLMMVQCTDSAQQIAALGDSAKYVNGVLPWSAAVSGSVYTDDDTNPYASHFVETATQTSARVFEAWFLNHTGTLPTYTDAATVAACYMMETALATALSSDRKTLTDTLARINVPSFWGTLGTDQIGMGSINAVIVTQVDDQLQQQLLSPTSAATSQFIFPAPTWSERVYVPSYMHMGGAQVVVGLACVCVSVYLGALFVVVEHRHEPLVLALSVWLIVTSLVGAIVTSLSILTWLDDNNATTCAARIPVGVGGLLLTLGPMITQTWILTRIFHNPKMVVVRTNRLLMLLRVIGLPALLTLLLSTLYPLLPVPYVFDVLRPSQNLTVCAAKDVTSAVRLGMCLLGVVLVIMCWWIRQVWTNRHTPHPMFAESKRIALAVTILVFMLGLVMAVEFGMTVTDRKGVEVKLMIRGVGILVSIFVSMAILYGMRLVEVVRMGKHTSDEIRHINRARMNHTVINDNSSTPQPNAPRPTLKPPGSKSVDAIKTITNATNATAVNQAKYLKKNYSVNQVVTTPQQTDAPTLIITDAMVSRTATNAATATTATATTTAVVVVASRATTDDTSLGLPRDTRAERKDDGRHNLSIVIHHTPPTMIPEMNAATHLPSPSAGARSFALASSDPFVLLPNQSDNTGPTTTLMTTMTTTTNQVGGDDQQHEE